MIQKKVAIIELLALAVLLYLLLFADSSWAFPVFEGGVIGKIIVFIHDPRIQYLGVWCLGCYFITFVLGHLLQPHGNKHLLDDAHFWLAGFVLFGFMRYLLADEIPSRSTQVPALAEGIICGKIISAWIHRRKTEIERHVVLIIGMLTCLLAGAALWPPKATSVFQYRNNMRWSGPWDNPNLYGLLMGTGLVLAVGLMAESITRLSREDFLRNGTLSGFIGQHRKRLFTFLYLGAILLMAHGLLCSYSRGAWFAVFCAICYLTINFSETSILGLIRRERVYVPRMALLICFIFILAFWSFKNTEYSILRRAFSFGNANDLSWHNRVDAWRSVLQMVAEKPWFGFGWDQTELVYEHYYLQSRLNEVAAVKMNDYLMIAATLGWPALSCFCMNLWLSIRGFESKNSETKDVQKFCFNWCPIKMICRAGAIVLAIGFFFDGGLFDQPTSCTFWILLELGK